MAIGNGLRVALALLAAAGLFSAIVLLVPPGDRGVEGGAEDDGPAGRPAALLDRPAEAGEIPAGPGPRFDVVRVEPDGTGVVAGQAAPGANVQVMAGDVVAAEAVADAAGNFVAFLALPPSAEPRTLELRGPDGTPSEATVILGPVPEGGGTSGGGEATGTAPGTVAAVGPGDGVAAADPGALAPGPPGAGAGAEEAGDRLAAMGSAEPDPPRTAEDPPKSGEAVAVPGDAQAEVGAAEPAPPVDPGRTWTDARSAGAIETDAAAVTTSTGGDAGVPADDVPGTAPDHDGTARAGDVTAASPDDGGQAPGSVALADAAAGRASGPSAPLPSPPSEAGAAPAEVAAAAVGPAGPAGGGSAEAPPEPMAVVAAAPVAASGPDALPAAGPGPSPPPALDAQREPTLGTDVAPTPQPAPVVADAAPTLPPPAAAAARPPVLVSDAEGVRVAQPALAPGATPEVLATVALDAITYGAGGEVALSGRGAGGGAVRLYLDDAAVGEVPISPDGRWSLDLADAAPGVHRLRVDQVGADGAVVSRIETPFQREAREVVAAALAERGVTRAGIAMRTVQPGSTLWAISRERWGDGMMYVQVFEANRDRIRDPDLIYPGQVFMLPPGP